MNDIEEQFIVKQKLTCEKYGAEFFPSPFEKFIGLASESFEKFNLPITGLRHPIENEQSTNWYVWAGEYSEADDFFKPVHIHHLLEVCPKAINYFGLPPGWRFLFDNNYDDVWFDENLLHI